MGTYNKEKYYYFMLKSNFFDNDVLKYLQNQPNGYEKIILYFKLIFKTINKDGYLIKILYDINYPKLLGDNLDSLVQLIKNYFP